MNDMTTLAMRADEQSYHEGAEDGFWRGYMVGAEACRRFIMGQSSVNPQAPDEFRPLGTRWYPINYAELEQLRSTNDNGSNYQ